MLNLIDGREAIIESVDNSFEPYVVHYAENFHCSCICWGIYHSALMEKAKEKKSRC